MATKPREEWQPIKEWSAMCIAAKEFRCKTSQMKCLLMYYAINSDRKGEFYKAALDICADTSMSERTVRYINALLKECGILKITRPVGMSSMASTYSLDYKALRAGADASQAAVTQTKQIAKDKARKRQAKWREAHPNSNGKK